MKTEKYIIKTLKLVLIISVLLVTIPFDASSQCQRRRYCQENMSDFDYSSQSTFASLYPGDTSRATVVLYNGQQYRIFVCADPELGDVSFQVLQPERRTKRFITNVRRDTLITYKTDMYGDYIYDEKGEVAIESIQAISDTTWQTERYTHEEVLFDSKRNKSGKPYFEYAPPKSGRIIVKVTVPSGGDPTYFGCVNLYVGRKTISSRAFQKGARLTQDY